MEVRKERKLRLFLTKFFLQKLTPGNVGKICTKGKIVCHNLFSLLQKFTPGNISKKGKKGKILS